MQNIAQALFISLKGSQLTPEEKKLIKTENPAGVILFKRNISSIKQTQTLIEEIKSLTKEPALLAVDCEGGQVNRLSHLGKAYPSPQKLSVLEEESIFQTARNIGKDLKDLGFDLNFAPVVDLPLAKSPLLETRVFGSSPEEVLKKAGAFMKGLLQEGIYPCLKHFPGHGAVKEDSHELLPIDFRTWEDLEDQLSVFEHLYNSYPSAIMTAHIVFPNIESTPASFSKILLTQFLKKKKNFQGLLFSDDIDMGALDGFSSGESVFFALQAGCDMVLNCQKKPFEIFEYFKKHPEKTQFLEKQLKESQLKKRKLLKFIASQS